MFIDHFKLS